MWLSLVLAVALVACGCRGDDARPQVAARVAAESTIAPGDYIGPSACGECHPDQHALWMGSLHRVMNQRSATDGAVVGNFEDARLRYGGGEARMERDASVEPAGYTMTLARDGRTVRYRVTRTIGRRGLQEYVGIEEGGPGEEVRLPLGWWPRRAGWYPQAFFDPWLDEDDVDIYAPVREPWAERCPWCHSTYPFEQRIARASGPRSLGHGLEQYFSAAATASERLVTTQQVTVGVSCESCHLGGRAHAAGAPIHFIPQGAEAKPGAPVPTTFALERRDAAIVNTVCAQCHSGPSPRLPDHSATRNSSEALDLAASACTTARCTDCHDPHGGGADEARAIAACTGCHETLVAPAAARAHAGSGHDGVTCLDCHMPRRVMGIDRSVRTHLISSPTDRAMLVVAAPNACNLCHLDRSIEWTVDELRERHDVRLAPDDWSAYGEPNAAVGEVWLASREPEIRVMAALAYARSPLGPYALAAVMAGLADPLPYVRTWTLFAVEDILGRTVREAEYDPRATSEVRRRQILHLRR